MLVKVTIQLFNYGVEPCLSCATRNRPIRGSLAYHSDAYIATYLKVAYDRIIVLVFRPPGYPNMRNKIKTVLPNQTISFMPRIKKEKRGNNYASCHFFSSLSH